MKRFVTPENKKWWTLAAVSVGLFMIMLDNTVVNVALPSIRCVARHEHRGPRVGRRRLRADVRRVHAHRRQARRLPRPAPDLHGRPRRLHGRLARVRARAERRLPDRRPRRAGPRRRADEPRDALDHHGDLRAARARQGDRHLGRRLGDGARDRAARRRPAHRARELELDLLHQRADRHRSACSRRRSSSPSHATSLRSSGSTFPASRRRPSASSR